MLSRIHMRQFLGVVDTGSFTRAANALHIAQPSLSAGIAELERQLGTPLFVRERRRIQLTEAGNRLLPIARAIEREFHQAEARIGNLPVPVRPMRIGILDTLPTAWLAAVFAAHGGQEPVDLTEGGERELRAALASGSIDLAVTRIFADAPQFSSEVLFREDYCLALPAGHPLAGLPEVAAQAVAGETMIARRACEILGETSRFFTERGVRPRFSLRSANDDRAMAMVGAGLGVTVAPRSLARPGVVMTRLAQFERQRTIGLVFGADWMTLYRPDHPLLEAFRAGTAELAAG